MGAESQEQACGELYGGTQTTTDDVPANCPLSQLCTQLEKMNDRDQKLQRCGWCVREQGWRIWSLTPWTRHSRVP